MITFTICSNNYIYKAQVLALSIKNLSNTPVYLFLADDIDERVDYQELNFEKIIYLNDLGVPNLTWMKEHYDVVELNTALKAFAFQYLFKNFDTNTIFYFDPDIKLYQPLTTFDTFWNGKNILLTPHALTPPPFDHKFPGENLFLNHGTYNLGFLALKRSLATHDMLNWWAERMLENCVIQLKEGFFVDQLWFNLVPLYFKNTSIIAHYGCNMAYWNLHERNLTAVNDQYMVNNNQSLIFYHFSNFDPNLKNICSVANFRYTFMDHPVLKSLYKQYLDDISLFKPGFYKGIKYFKGDFPIIVPQPGLISRAFRKFLTIINRG